MDNAKAISFMDRLRANKKKLNIILRNQDRNNDRQIQEIYDLKKKHQKEKTDFERKIKCCNKQSQILNKLYLYQTSLLLVKVSYFSNNLLLNIKTIKIYNN
jgi:hypothetical protein